MSKTNTQTQAPPAGAVATIGGKPSLVMKMAARYGVDADKFGATLKATAFNTGKGPEVTNEQMMALLVVANEYGLNPFTKEIYAFPTDKGIVPIIGVDGWIRMINEHPQLESMELRYAEDGSENPWIECVINRKDRSAPIVIREYMDECKRNTGPWNSHPRRMLRHKAIIQCARVAFGFGGVYDPDEGERIVATQETTVTTTKPATAPPRAKSKTPPPADPEPTVERITLDQATHLRDKLHEEGIEINALCARFEIGSVEDLAADEYDAANTWIDAASAG